MRNHEHVAEPPYRPAIDGVESFITGGAVIEDASAADAIDTAVASAEALDFFPSDATSLPDASRTIDDEPADTASSVADDRSADALFPSETNAEGQAAWATAALIPNPGFEVAGSPTTPVAVPVESQHRPPRAPAASSRNWQPSIGMMVAATAACVMFAAGLYKFVSTPVIDAPTITADQRADAARLPESAAANAAGSVKPSTPVSVDAQAPAAVAETQPVSQAPVDGGGAPTSVPERTSVAPPPSDLRSSTSAASADSRPSASTAVATPQSAFRPSQQSVAPPTTQESAPAAKPGTEVLPSLVVTDRPVVIAEESETSIATRPPQVASTPPGAVRTPVPAGTSRDGESAAAARPSRPEDRTVTNAASTVATAKTEMSDEDAVRTIVNRYRTAFSSLDVNATVSVWPRVDTRALKRAFDRLQEQEVVFDVCDIQVSGAQAVALCAGTARYVPKVGSRNRTADQRQWTFILQKAANGWLINGVNAQ